MKFFIRNRKATIVNRYFGDLELHGECWSGKVFFPPENVDLQVCISGNEAGVDREAEEQWLILPERYNKLRPSIASELFALYSDYVKQLDEGDLAEDFPRPLAVGEIWSAFSLILINLLPQKHFELVYCFSESNDDSLFTINVEGETVKGQYTGD